MSLEPTDEQIAELAKCFEAETLQRAAAKAGLGYDDLVRILWPLIRDMVLQLPLCPRCDGDTMAAASFACSTCGMMVQAAKP